MRAIACCLLLLASVTAAIAGDAPPPAAPGKIAVLRLVTLIQGYKPYQAGIEVVKAEDAKAQGTLKKIDEEIQAAQKKAELLVGDAQAQEIEKAETAKTRAKLFQDRTLKELERRQVVMVRDSFTQVRGFLKDYCQERGVMLVIQASPEREFDAPNMRELQLLLGIQATLFAEPGLDITDDFLRYANKRADEAAAKGATPAPGPLAPGPMAPATDPAPTAPAPR